MHGLYDGEFLGFKIASSEEVELLSAPDLAIFALVRSGPS